MKTYLVDKALFEYIANSNSSPIVELYQDFIQEYVSIITSEQINLKNKRHRYLITLFVKDKRMIGQIKGGIFMGREEYKAIRQVVRYIKDLMPLSKNEIFNELLIPFLELIKSYRNMGSTLDNYIRYNYNYYLKNHLKLLSKDPIDYAERYDYQADEKLYLNVDLITNDIYFETTQKELDLLHPRFISGEETVALKELSTIDRLILVYYYDRGLRDKKIAIKLALHPSSVQRRRKQLVDQLYKKVESGELPCLKLNH